MALSLNTVFEVRTGGSDTNSGGFVTGASGTDWSQQNSPQYSVTDGVTAGTTTITSATANFGTDVVGNIIYVQGGTGGVIAGWYQIISRSNSTTIVVDRTTGLTAGTGVTLHIGGALLSPSVAAALMSVNGMMAYIKNDGAVFSITSASSSTNGGVLVATGIILFIGYSTNRTFPNTDTQPIIQTNVASATTVNGGSSVMTFYNITFDGNSQTACKLANAGNFIQCLFKNFNTASTNNGSVFCTFKNCGATTCSGSPFIGICVDCEAWANTVTPFNSVEYCIRCIATSNTGGTTDGFNGSGLMDSCIAVSNGRNGFTVTGAATSIFNCISESNTGVGYSQGGGVKQLLNCYSYNNTGGATSGTFNGTPTPSTNGSFFVTAPTNLSPNNIPGAGILLRATIYPTIFPRTLSTTYGDTGPIQHQDNTTLLNITRNIFLQETI